MQPRKTSFHLHNFNPECIPISHQPMLRRRKVYPSCAHFALYLVFENVFVDRGGPGQVRLCSQVADVVCAAVFQRNQVVDFYVDLVASLRAMPQPPGF